MSARTPVAPDTPRPDPIDREVFLARSGQPHNPAIAHLAQTHSLPGSAGYLLEGVLRERKDPDTARILGAIRQHRDADPASPTFGCYKWYLEDTAVFDTNASFFVCSPLAGLWLAARDKLAPDELAALRAVFADVLPWFRHMARAPSLFYPNKCISDAAMLLATGHVLGEPAVVQAGRDFVARYFDYYRRRGTGWGEDHSPVYTRVIVEMALLIMALEGHGPLLDQARQLTDNLLDWMAFHNGLDAVPSIRGYNFGCQVKVNYAIASLSADQDTANPRTLLDVLRTASGYRFQPPALPFPRLRRWRTFDSHFSTSYIGTHARLGTLSHYPLMPNSYMHDGWGLGWQSKPASFILGQEEYGVLEWLTEDDEGVVRQHEANGTFHDWPSRHLFKRSSFHPDVVLVGHQHQGAAILFRELHRVHSPTRRIVDRWRLAPGRCRLFVEGQEWDGTPCQVAPGWVVIQHQDACLALRPLKCRVLDPVETDRNPQRRTAGAVRDLALGVDRSDRGMLLSLRLVDDHTGTLVQPLLFSGWCIALLAAPDQVTDLRVTESFHEDGEVPRTYGELIRTVALDTPGVSLKLVRDMATGKVSRFVDDTEFVFSASPG